VVTASLRDAWPSALAAMAACECDGMLPRVVAVPDEMKTSLALGAARGSFPPTWVGKRSTEGFAIGAVSGSGCSVGG
jgi:hypothetical protein